MPTKLLSPVASGSSPLALRNTAVSALANRQVKIVLAPASITARLALNVRMPGAGTGVGALATTGVANGDWGNVAVAVAVAGRRVMVAVAVGAPGIRVGLAVGDMVGCGVAGVVVGDAVVVRVGDGVTLAVVVALGVVVGLGVTAAFNSALQISLNATTGGGVAPSTLPSPQRQPCTSPLWPIWFAAPTFEYCQAAPDQSQ